MNHSVKKRDEKKTSTDIHLLALTDHASHWFGTDHIDIVATHSEVTLKPHRRQGGLKSKKKTEISTTHAPKCKEV